MNSLFQQLNETGVTAVAPSVLSADFSCLRDDIKAAEDAGADCLHLDVMDGHFVPNITFGPMVVEAISKIAAVPLVTHLMISDPGKFIEPFARAGSAAISFHWEAVESGHREIVEKIHSAGCDAGIALNPDTPFSAVEGVLEEIDILLIMTVFPGFGGQKFMTEVLSKIEEAASYKRKNGSRYVIEVDGGVKPENAGLVRSAGGMVLVAGTAVFKSGDYSKAIAAIRGE